MSPPPTCGGKAALPATPYLFSARYGWFDPNHFAAGRPDHLIRNVRRAAAAGGGLVTVSQDLRDGLTGYAARYWVSGNLRSEHALSAALGIYLDWGRRFETWQSEPPRVIAGPLTPFALEDLPSRYLGFVAAAHGLTPAQVIGCYLGVIEGREDGPPHFAIVPGEGVDKLVRLENQGFTPMVETQQGWQHVPWPAPMRMIALGSGPRTWSYVDEQTWYLNDRE